MIKKYELNNNVKVYESENYVLFIYRKYNFTKVVQKYNDKSYKDKKELINSSFFCNEFMEEIRYIRKKIFRYLHEIYDEVPAMTKKEFIETFVKIENRTFKEENVIKILSLKEAIDSFFLRKLLSGKKIINLHENRKYISFELELISSLSKDKLVDMLMSTLDKKTLQTITICRDSSIATDERYRYAHEIKISCEQHEYKQILNKISRILLDEKFFAVNASCGMHVHLDARHNDKEKMYNNLKKIKRLLFAIVPHSRRNNRYCSFRLVKTCRYRAINYQAYYTHRTIEVRCHSATLDDRKISAFAELLIATAYAENLPNKLPLRLNKILSVLGIPHLENYFSERIKKFNSDEKVLRKFFGNDNNKNDNNINNLKGDQLCV